MVLPAKKNPRHRQTTSSGAKKSDFHETCRVWLSYKRSVQSLLDKVNMYNFQKHTLPVLGLENDVPNRNSTGQARPCRTWARRCHRGGCGSDGRGQPTLVQTCEITSVVTASDSTASLQQCQNQ
eukprot:4734445-Amphidinium_carterae.1